MAIVINNTPSNYSSVNGDLLYTAYEATKANDPTTYPNYKYVCDIYVGGVMVSRLKAFPDPINKRGIFNIGRTVRNYMAFQFNPTASAFKVQEFGDTQFRLSVQCKFGEEYGTTLTTNLTNDSTRLFYNHYNGRLTSSDTILNNYTDTYAGNGPSTRYLHFGGRCFVPWFGTSAETVSVTLAAFNASGTYLGGGSKTTSIAVANNLGLFDIGPLGVNALFAGTFTITTAVAYYNIILGSTLFNVNLYCEGKYTPYSLHFMNQLGGFESFDFRKVSRKTVDIERKTYQQQAYRFDDSGAAYLRTSGNVMNDTVTTYAIGYTEKMKLYSDIMTDAQYRWLAELFQSPVVYFDDGGYLVPVTITTTNYEYKKVINDKLTSLLVELDFGQQLNTQYR